MSESARPSRGFASAAPVYVAAGWAPFPLPAGAKSPPPTGYTGANGRAPTVADVTRWCSSNAFGNIGLHLSATTVGLDVDDYEGKEGAATLSALVDAHGQLPATWSSTSRGEGASRIWFFRIPAGVVFPGVLGSGIDVIQNHHRYAVVAPSTHPDTSERYRWWSPEGAIATAPPHVDDLADLPAAWVEALQWRQPELVDPAPTVFADPSDHDSIAERINRDHSWHDVLIGDGWHLAHVKANETAWVRPGKDARAGISAVLHEPDGPLNLFSSSVPALQQPWAERQQGALWSFSMFGYLAATRYGGDRSVCAREYRLQTNAADAQFRTLSTAQVAASVLDGDDELVIIDWSEQRDQSAELVEGLVITGRWTAIAAAAKAGKSSLLVSVSVEVSEGRHPFDATPIEPVRVLYVDAEMGRLDLEGRLIECGYEPARLSRWWACDIPPRLDTPQGAAKVLTFVRTHKIQFVLIDGINGTVGGAEKDDTPWRLLFEYTIRPLKEMGVAVSTADNLGKDSTLGPRGSSVKLDKADAVFNLTRTAAGVNLHASHRRTATFASDLRLDVFGIDGDEPLHYRQSAGHTYPDGTKELADLLDELDVDPGLGRDPVREILRAKGLKAGNKLLSEAIKWRKQARLRFWTGENPVVPAEPDGQPDSSWTEAPDQGGQGPGQGWTEGGGSEWTAGGVVTPPVHDLGAADPAKLWDE
jgi:hypothetical protein